MLAFAALVLLPNLGGYALWDPDEGRHAEVAREMLAASDWRGWVVPRFDFEPYHDKPVLLYWAAAGAQAALGVTETAVRLVPALAALLAVLGVYGWGAAVWGVRAGLFAGVVLVGSVEFIGLARYVNLDMLLTLWVTAALLAFQRWTERPGALRWLVAAAVATGLGALAKGLVSPVLVGTIGLAYLGATRRLGVVRPGPVLIAGAVVLVVAAPWYVAAGLVDPGYMREFLLRHHVERFTEGSGRFHSKPVYFPSAMLLAGFFPWSALLPATLHGTLGRGRWTRADVFCAVWAVLVLAFFTASRGKLGTYILPAFPPLALLTGRYLATLDRAAPPAPVERRLVIGGLAGLAVVTLLVPVVAAAVAARLYEGAWLGTSALAAATLPLGLALAAIVARRRLDLAPHAIAAGTLVVSLVFYLAAAPRISAVVSDAALARTIAAEPGEPPVVAYQARPASLVFYLRRRVPRLAGPARLARALDQAPLVFVVSSPQHVHDLVATGRLHAWATGGRHVLYATRQPG